MNNNDLLGWILKVTVGTLALICISTVGVLLIGLYEDGVSNEKIFETISPAFNTVVGAFVGLLGGLSINKGSSNCDKDKKDKA
jgi:hypothetical protein